MIPHTSTPVWLQQPANARAASRWSRTPDGCTVALLGLPDETGVALNGGRPGAAGGPAAFRHAIARYGVATPDGFAWPAVFDAGDIIPAPGSSAESLLQTHRRIHEATSALLALNLFPIAIGGGHDLTLPFAGAVFDHFSKLHPASPHEVIYFDAHLDVRETVGSGMPFRKLIESHGVTSLAIIGADPFANAADHAAWFRAHGGTFASEPPPVHPGSIRTVSFDLDALDSSVAPGVSAINPCGLSMPTVDPQIRRLGADPTVRAFDIMELSPPHDADGRTARIAARLFLSFLRGFAERST